MMMRLRAYAQLIRLPNLPSALADICLAALALCAFTPEEGGLDRLPVFSFVCLLIASACLYSGGMVWNDYFDVEQDKKERPFRPIPAGHVSLREAGRLGSGLFLAGLCFAWLAGQLSPQPHSASLVIALLLIPMILLYDGWLKKDWAGPLAMGTCRFLNVLLGLSLVSSVPMAWHLHLASIVGLFIVGLTWFARTEARESEVASLQKASGLMFASFAIALMLPLQSTEGTTSFLFPYLLVTLGFFLGIPLVGAMGNPTPERVQKAVKRLLMGLILLDAVLATALAGTWGLLILILMVPSIILNRKRWLYAT